MDLNNLRIIGLEAENVKRLRAVSITPEGNLVEIAGKNGQGKTSILDAIWWALGGTKGIQSEPVRRGQGKARICIRLGKDGEVGLIVERSFTSKGNHLSVKYADGSGAEKKQTLLDSLLGAMTFDPLGFMRMDQKKQADVLRSMVKLDIDLEQNAAEIKKAFDTRTDVNRDAKSLRAQVDAITVECDADAERVDESELISKMENAATVNTDIQRRASNREQATAKIAQQRKTAEEKRATATRLIEEAEALEAESDLVESRIAAAGNLPPLVDVSEVRAQLDAAKKINAALDEKARKDKLAAEAKAKEDEAAALTAKIDALTTAKMDAIKAAKMPVKGLGFGDDCVTYNGLPLDQASDAEQLKVSTAIAAALNPKLRVLRIRDGSLLDQDSMAWLAAFAEANDFQIWVETVGAGSGPAAIIIEDGHVKGQEIQQAAE